MKWMEISVVTVGRGIEPVAALFDRLDCSGVMIEDLRAPRYHLESIDKDESSEGNLSCADPVRLKAYFHEGDKVLSLIESGLDTIQNIFGISCQIKIGEIEDDDWAHNWKQYYHPFRVGERLVIKPTWENYVTQNGDVVIEIDPGMAFGTGIHASTRFCLNFIDQYVKGGEKILDAGCGSGILSLAAAGLGAAEILAMDSDKLAVKIARQNVEINRLNGPIKVAHGDIFSDLIQESADIIMANLTADVILSWLPVAMTALRGSGLIFASGIQDRRWPEVKQAMEQAGLTIEQLLLDAEWAGVVARRR